MAAAFTTLSGTLATDLGTVAAAGVVILVIFLAWRLGKKLFKSIAS